MMKILTQKMCEHKVGSRTNAAKIEDKAELWG
jgi:hypothetical protein